jgi:hypothetical protein
MCDVKVDRFPRDRSKYKLPTSASPFKQEAGSSDNGLGGARIPGIWQTSGRILNAASALDRRLDAEALSQRLAWFPLILVQADSYRYLLVTRPTRSLVADPNALLINPSRDEPGPYPEKPADEAV